LGSVTNKDPLFNGFTYVGETHLNWMVSLIFSPVWIYNLLKKWVIHFCFVCLFFVFVFVFSYAVEKEKKTSDDFYCLFIHMMYMIFFSLFFFCSLHSVWWTNSAPPVPNLLASTLISYYFFFIHLYLSLSLSLLFVLLLHTCRYVCVNWPCLVICVRVLFHDDYIIFFL
jgi:hypothetical protein